MNDPKNLKDLPTEIEIPEDIDLEDDDAISDYITGLTGFCHKGFKLKESTPTHKS